MEAEIQRRKEHINYATNFEKARGFVRTNWKSKHFNPAKNPIEEPSSDESYGEEDEDEQKDKVVDTMSRNIKENDDEYRSRSEYSEDRDLKSYPDAVNLSGKKYRKRIPQPSDAEVIDVT